MEGTMQSQTRFSLIFSILVICLLVSCYPSTSEVSTSDLIDSEDINDPVVQELPTKTTKPTLPKATKIPSYPNCANVAPGTNTTCMIPNAYCSYEPNVDGSPTFCNDAPYPTNNFTFLIWDNDLSYLDGKCIVIQGNVVLYKGKPEITANSIDQFVGYCD
jgi:hypothetical protein